jgi:hypothetical protein
MRETWRDEVLSKFHASIQARYPTFDHITKEARRWNWQASITPHLFFFFEVITHIICNNTSSSLPGARTTNFPLKGTRPTQLKMAAPNGRIRLRMFWSPGGLEPNWDLCPERTKFFSEHISTGKFVPAPEVAIDQLPIRLPTLIEDAMAKFEQYGVPMFRQVAEAHGVWAPFGV